MKLVVFILFIPFYLQAQLIDNRDCNAFTNEPFFYTTFVKENKIKSIKGSVSTKKNLQVIEQKNDVTAYHFDEKGNLIKHFSSFGSLGEKDTTYIDYIYDSVNQLITQRTSDSYGFFSYNFNYDNKQRVIEKTYCRDENGGKDRYHFELKKQYTVVKEGYSYEEKDSIITKNVLNNHGRAYLKEHFIYNNLGLLKRIEKKLIVNKKRSLTTFNYNDMGLVAEKIEIPDVSKENQTRFTYQYDEFGNLEYIDEYKNGEKLFHKEVIYNKSTYLMKALLIQDVKTNFIKIIKYQYSFYE